MHFGLTPVNQIEIDRRGTVKRHSWMLVTIMFFMTTNQLSAEIPQVINYQGRVTDSGGNPVADGDYTMRFRIYDAVTSGTLEWDSGDRTVSISDGGFEVLLGESPQPAITLEFEENYWLEVTIETDVQSPREQLGSVGYAYMASGLVAGTEVIGSVGTETKSAIKATNTSTTDETYGVYGSTETTHGFGVVGVHPGYDPDGDLGTYWKPGGFFGGRNGVVGLSKTQDGFGVLGLSNATSGSGYGGYFSTNALNGTGVYGYATDTAGSNFGVYGISSSIDGRGVHGFAVATQGNNYGVYGESASTSGRGVYGYVGASSGNTYGVHGQSASSEGTGVFGYTSAQTGTTYGGRFESYSVDGMGVFGKAWATTGWSYGGSFECRAANGTGVYGHTTSTEGTNLGVHGRTESPYGKGVYGEAPATTGVNYGVYGESWSTDGTGVSGRAMASTGITYGVKGYNTSESGSGVYGHANSGSGDTYGVYGRSGSTDGTGVYAEAYATEGSAYGIYAESSSTWGKGVYGVVTATNGTGDGVRGKCEGTGGAGVVGYATAFTGTNIGVIGRSFSASGWGVYGWASASTGTTYGVRGAATSAAGYGGYFVGDVHVGGSLSKTSGSFLIDHPLDPENKLLRHNFMESPENLVVYRGKVELDGNGKFVVEMPEYFKALTREVDATVHLTPIGRSPSRIPSYEWRSGRDTFEIYGDPGSSMAWMVMAERDDPSMQRLMRPVEEEKGPENKYCDKGKLLDPIAYGYPESMGRDYQKLDGERLRMEEEQARMEARRLALREEQER